MTSISSNTNSNRGFNYALAAILILVVSFVILVALHLSGYDSGPAVVGIPIVVAPILANIGLVYSIKGRRDPNTFKKIFGLCVNILILLFLLAVILANAIDIFRALD